MAIAAHYEKIRPLLASRGKELLPRPDAGNRLNIAARRDDTLPA